MLDPKSDDKQKLRETLDEAMRRAGVTADLQGNISAQDAIRLKHSINENIRYGGFNAREIWEKREVSDDWSKTSEKWCEEGIKAWGYHVRPESYAVPLGLVLAGYWLPQSRAYLAVAFVVVVMWIARKAGMAAGFKKGFAQGFGGGFGAGVESILGISAAESPDVRERATEMLKDAMLIAKFNAMKKDP